MPITVPNEYTEPMVWIEPDRAPTTRELQKWRELIEQYNRATNAVDRASLLFSNILAEYNFAARNKTTVPGFDATLEQRLFAVIAENGELRAAIRGVEDHKYGIRLKNNDIDILQPNNQKNSFSGLVIPIIAGVAILTTAIAVAVYQSREATELAIKFAKVVTSVDKRLCANPNSQVCKAWKKEKIEKSFDKKQTLAESLKEGVSTFAGKIGTGLLIAIPLAAYFIWGRNKK